MVGVILLVVFIFRRGRRQSEFHLSFRICSWGQNGWDGSFQWGYQESWNQLEWQFLPFFSSNVFHTQNGEILKGPLAIWKSSIATFQSLLLRLLPLFLYLSGSVLKFVSMIIDPLLNCALLKSTVCEYSHVVLASYLATPYHM